MAGQHAKGAVSTAKGNAKEAAGKLTSDKKLETEGRAQKAQGKAQDTLGKAQGRGRLHPIVISAVGAAVVVVAALLTGLLRMGRGRD